MPVAKGPNKGPGSSGPYDNAENKREIGGATWPLEPCSSTGLRIAEQSVEDKRGSIGGSSHEENNTGGNANGNPTNA